jgi:NAD(P)-dependent dehydrogenase (short-subunit alcohol dehydrogenase family)
MTRCALITGVAGTIGAATARRFKTAGYRVCGLDVVEIGDSAVELPLRVDLDAFVRDEAVRDSTISRVREWLAGASLHALVNNAAHQVVSTAHPIGVDALQTSYNVNVIAPYLLVAHLAADMAPRIGSVVNVGSIHARLSKPGFIAYATTKAAVSALTRGLALDYGDRFRVNCVEPASVRTPMLVDGFRGAADALHGLEAYHPQGRIAEPEEIAELIYQITSPELRFLHGSCIDISGGIGGRLHDPA